MAKAPTKATASSRESDDAQDRLKAFYERRHPAYDELIGHWTFLEQTYRGGRAWFVDNIFRYFKEGEKEFTDRLARAYRFNHTREVVDLVQKYLFKTPPARAEDAPDEVKKFWNRETKNGLDIDQLMRQGSVANSIGGRSAIVVDNNFRSVAGVEEDRKVSQREVDEAGFRIYAYVVPAKHILDYAFDEDGDGELLWIKLREIVRDDADPLNSTGQFVYRVRLWTRDEWMLYEEVEERGNARQEAKKNVVMRDRGTHNLGFVPVKLFDHTIGEDPYRVPGLIDDIAYLDRSIANYLSSLDAIIQDQTFSQLAIPAQIVQQGDDMYNKVLEMGTKRVFVYDSGGGGAKPEFLSPDPKQAGVILSVINKIINEIYHTIGLAGERTKEDNAVGIDNSSGVAKAYDFERVNSLLLSKARSCEHVENWIVRTVLAWSGKPAPEEDLVTYPTTFDVMRLVDDLVTAEALAKLEAPRAVRRLQMRALVDKLLPQLKQEEHNEILEDIENWLDDPEIAPPPRVGGSTATAREGSAASESRQGQITAETD